MAAWSVSRLCREARQLADDDLDGAHFACSGCACSCHGRPMPDGFRDVVAREAERAREERASELAEVRAEFEGSE